MHGRTVSIQPRLVAMSGSLEGQVFEIGPGPFTLGRLSSNQLQLEYAAVSRRHCVIERDGESWVLKDLGSSCGTYVNGVVVTQRRLAHGDTFQVGDALFLFLTEEPTADVTRPPDGRYALASTIEMPTSEILFLDADRVLESLPPDEEKARHLGALLKISQAVHSIRSVGELSRRLVELVFDVVGAERAAVLLDDGGELETVCSAARSGDGEPTVSRSIARRVMTERLAVLSNDVHVEARGTASLDPERVRSLLCVPLVSHEGPLGVVWAEAGKPDAHFTQEEMELLSAAAGMAGVAIANARRQEWLERENRRLRDTELDHDIVGESPAVAKLLQFLGRVSPTDLTVLVLGESGTGKELVARALHHNSPRAEGPYVVINCATLSETLLESELFGHEKGAFTGAVGRKPGKLEVADGGTVFLDEVGEIPVALQAKLLRALESKEFERVGGTRPLRVDVRFVAATNRDLEKAIEEGTFRRDLYHRLNVFSLGLPPLRERDRDALLLAHHFAAQTSRRLGREFLGLSREARACLLAYGWPGNVRELKNAVERAVVLSVDGIIRPEDLPEALLEGTADEHTTAAGYHARVNEAKRRILHQAIERADGNLSEAANQLGLNRTYLHRLIKNLGIASGA